MSKREPDLGRALSGSKAHALSVLTTRAPEPGGGRTLVWGAAVLDGGTEDEELEWRPKAGLVSDPEANVGAMSKRRRAGVRSSMTSSEAWTLAFLPFPHFPGGETEDLCR